LVENGPRTKVCSRCRRELPLSRFAKRAASRDGLQNYCRQCTAEWAQEHRPRKQRVGPAVAEGMKWCRRCEVVRPMADFPKHSKTRDGLQVYCRTCFADSYRQRRAAAGKVVRPADVPDGHKFCRGCQQIKPQAAFSGITGKRARLTFRCNDCTSRRDRERHLQYSYGLTEADVAAMLTTQRGVCAICQAADAVHIDHDHATDAVRGMLCFRCNAALGQLDDDPEVLVRAARYLLSAAGQHVPADVWFVDALVEFDRHGPAS